jgi:hypothetical protein
MAPLQLKRFQVGSKMAIAASAPVLPNHKKSVAKSPDSLTHPVYIELWSVFFWFRIGKIIPVNKVIN